MTTYQAVTHARTLRRVWQAIDKEPCISPRQLAVRTGLALSAVRRVIEELEQHEAVAYEPKKAGTLHATRPFGWEWLGD